MPSPALTLLVAALLPLVGFAVLLASGRRLGEPLAGWFGTTLIAGSFLCSLLAMFQWYTGGGVGADRWGYAESAVRTSARWLPIGPEVPTAAAGAVPADHAGWADVGLYVDSLTIAMVAMVTVVALIVHIFAIGYMRRDGRLPRFFAYLGLFCFAMLGLILSSTLLQLFVFWELVGFCSYLLIGFWFERRSAARASAKAFVVNRVGDCCFLAGLGLLMAHVGNASLPHLWAALGTASLGGDVHVPGGAVVPAGAMTAIGALLFAGAAAKSAQFPFHAWLPDAMAGPSPVSALIHAATMVAAGVYLVARLFPVLTPDAKLLIAVVGCVTLALGSVVAMAQNDFKKVLAYSTIAQLGYMMLAIGVGSWVGGLFHLITHAFFKALLFLGAGSVIHAARGEQDLRQYGGLAWRIPVTAFCFGVAVLAIAGVGIGEWGLSGYHSKQHLLTDAAAFGQFAAWHGRPAVYWLLFVVPAAATYLTAFYMTRCWMLAFWGKPRNVFLYGRARETPMMYVPMLGLAVMTVIAGWGILNVRPLLDGAIKESSATVRRLAATAHGGPVSPFPGWATAWPSGQGATSAVTPDADDEPADEPVTDAQRAHDEGHRLEQLWVTWSWPTGILLGMLLYRNGPIPLGRFAARGPVRRTRAWLGRGMDFDALYDGLATGATAAVAGVVGWFDRTVVDGTVNAAALVTRRLAQFVGWHDARVVDGAVAGVARSARSMGAAARAAQTGRLRAYVTAAVVVLSAAAATAVAFTLWRK